MYIYILGVPVFKSVSLLFWKYKIVNIEQYSYYITPPNCPSPEQLYPQVFDGAKFVIQKGLSQHFQTMHTLTLASSTQPTQWQFGATYVGAKKIGDNDVSS